MKNVITLWHAPLSACAGSLPAAAQPAPDDPVGHPGDRGPARDRGHETGGGGEGRNAVAQKRPSGKDSSSEPVKGRVQVMLVRPVETAARYGLAVRYQRLGPRAGGAWCSGR